MVSKSTAVKAVATPSESAAEHLVNPFEDPQTLEIEMVLTRVAEDLTRCDLSADSNFEVMKSLCKQSDTYRNFARLCALRDNAERLKAEIAATRKAAKESLMYAAAPTKAEVEEDTINL